MDSTKFLHSLNSYLSTGLTLFRFVLNRLIYLTRIPICFTLVDTLFSFYYRFCGLSPFTIDLDDQTTVHFWTSSHRHFDRPNLVMVHGYGGDARWQFLYQIRQLSQKFNIFVPDLLFFGKSYSRSVDRTEEFQARCLGEGLKKLGADRYSVYCISYGGFVAYKMAERYTNEVEKVVIVSTGVGYKEDQKEEQIQKIGRDPRDLLLPKNTDDLRLLVSLSVYKVQPLKWLPDFFLQDFIKVMGNTHRKEKLELVEHLLAKKADLDLPILTQETLLIWGDQDNVFPINLAYQLQRHLGPKSRLEIIKDTGHAVNIESPAVVNRLITSFVLDRSHS